MNKEKVLIVEDDQLISQFMARAIDGAGFESSISVTAESARKSFLSDRPDVVILDLGLPDDDGLNVLTDMKAASVTTPIIIVSARERENEKVKAFDLGADDYVTKPFGIFELIARIKTAIRHTKQTTIREDTSEIFRLGDLVMNVPQHKVMIGEDEIHLTTKEFSILELLFRNRGKLLTHTWLMQQIWGDFIPDDNQILRVNMANIRRKLKENVDHPRYIKTELGVGYRMLEESAEES